MSTTPKKPVLFKVTEARGGVDDVTATENNAFGAIAKLVAHDDAEGNNVASSDTEFSYVVEQVDLDALPNILAWQVYS